MSSEKNEKKLYIISALVLLVLIIVVTIIQSTIQSGLIINGKNISEQKTNKNQRCIYISGEVKKQGVVCIDKEETLGKAISNAGGLNKNADISTFDENRKVLDGEKLHIRKKANENKNDKEVIEKNNNENGKININKATLKELSSLEGIGPATANKIIEYRKNNVFENIEELKNVKGIGEAKYNKIMENICVK